MAYQEQRLRLTRAVKIVRGEEEAYAFEEVIAAWQLVHDAKRHYALLPWQLGVMQNLICGQVIEGEPEIVPGLPDTFRVYGALREPGK
jgi:hypothetical protein